MAAGFLSDEEDKHCRAWRSGDSQVLQILLTNFFTFRLGPRCSYNSTGVNHETHIGGTAGDEMCNLYIMYFTGIFCTIFQLLLLSGALYVIALVTFSFIPTPQCHNWPFKSLQHQQCNSCRKLRNITNNEIKIARKT